MRIEVDVARTVINAAYRARRTAEVRLSDPLCPVDVAAKLGLEVRYEPLSSLEGLYLPNAKAPVIILGSLRPKGRQAFTCSHEIGHHILGHVGSRVEIIPENRDGHSPLAPEEAEANLFASHFLAPLPAIEGACRIRGWTMVRLGHIEAYTLASLFGLGYTTILGHLHFNLKLMSADRYTSLKEHTPASIAQALVGKPCSGLIVVDHCWSGRAIDLRVGDDALLPPGTETEGTCVETVSSSGQRSHIRAVRPGVATCFRRKDGWSACIRITPDRFQGRAMWRHLESDDEQ